MNKVSKFAHAFILILFATTVAYGNTNPVNHSQKTETAEEELGRLTKEQEEAEKQTNSLLRAMANHKDTICAVLGVTTFFVARGKKGAPDREDIQHAASGVASTFICDKLGKLFKKYATKHKEEKKRLERMEELKAKRNPQANKENKS